MSYNRTIKAGGKRAFSLFDCLTRPTGDSGWGDRISTPYGSLYYRDNGASVLGVAHLDSVLRAPPEKEGPFVYAPQLDDRLGVWILLDVLPRLGVKVDVLLTDCEEIGQTTARFFRPNRDYNWIFEFDRRGSDVVMYQYESDAYSDLLRDYGFRLGRGSYSDIAALEHLGVTRFHNDHKRHWLPFDPWRDGWRDGWRDDDWADDDWADGPLDATAKRLGKAKRKVDRSTVSGEWWQENLTVPEAGAHQVDIDTVREVARNFGYRDVAEFIRDGGLQFCY